MQATIQGKMKDFLLTCFFLFLLPFYSQNLDAQVPVQTIRGKITDKVTLEPIKGASVVLMATSTLGRAITDSSGYFVIKNISPGRYKLLITHIGYEDQIVPDVLLNAGKEQVVEIGLTIRQNILKAVTIIGKEQAGNDPIDIDYLSNCLITVDKTQRFAATFYDPARIIASGPGVNITNDQANHLIVRGNNPNGLLWRVEGVDVVNPNHLTNAGTFTDRPSLSGGGVSVLSTQLMANSKFLTGAFPSGYGNALSGVMDVYLRNGNNQKYEFTGQASFLGIDLCAEGPFSKRYEGSFLINYRYSTLGLFALAGIPIGDEKINFQDLSFNISFPTLKWGKFTFFGIGGKSITVFTGARDSLKWIYRKDRTDVDFYSDLGIIGVTHTIAIDEKSGIRTSAAYSLSGAGRDESFILRDYSSVLTQTDKLSLFKKSVSSYYFRRLNRTNLIKAGVVADVSRVEINSQNASSPGSALLAMHEGNARSLLIEPYVHWQLNATSALTINSGLHFNYSVINKALSAEPRISVKWNLDNNKFITAGYGLYSQTQHPAIYFNTIADNRMLGFTKASHFVAGFTARLTDDLVFSSEFYYQYLFKVPVSANIKNSFSALNLTETSDITERLVNKGLGKNYGIDLSLEKHLNKSYYFLLAGSLYSSRYKGSDNIERNTRYNGNYLLKITAGKEFPAIRKSQKNIMSINLSASRTGGMRYTPIDVNRSELTGTTIYIEEEAFSRRLKDFFRMDIRFMWRRNKQGYTRTFAIDIRNLTNYRNVAYYYYDAQQKKVVMENQLGIIPFLSYRVEF